MSLDWYIPVILHHICVLYFAHFTMTGMYHSRDIVSQGTIDGGPGVPEQSYGDISFREVPSPHQIRVFNWRCLQNVVFSRQESWTRWARWSWAGSGTGPGCPRPASMRSACCAAASRPRLFRSAAPTHSSSVCLTGYSHKEYSTVWPFCSPFKWLTTIYAQSCLLSCLMFTI